MKIFEIYDEERDCSVGTLLFFERSKRYVVELVENLDEWTAPLLFTRFVKEGIFTMPGDISYMWVRERLIPSGRQNIGSILNRHKLKEYDEMRFLEISNGRCSQDSLYIKKLDSLPEYVIKRAEKNLADCEIIGDNTLLCIFANGVLKRVSLSNFSHLNDIDKVLKNKDLFKTVKPGPGGYAILFDETIEIPANLLYNEGTRIPLSANELATFINSNLLDTSDTCNLLECSRQNLSYLNKENRLIPAMENVKGNLYRKGDVLKNYW